MHSPLFDLLNIIDSVKNWLLLLLYAQAYGDLRAIYLRSGIAYRKLFRDAVVS